jgi:hypothetical protein
MTIFKCNICQKTFLTNQRFQSHNKRKIPCIPPPICNDKIAVSFVLQGISYETLINLIGNDKIISSQYTNLTNISNDNAVLHSPLTINIVKQPVNNNLTIKQIPKETVETTSTVNINNNTVNINNLTTEQTPVETTSTVNINNNTVNINNLTTEQTPVETTTVDINNNTVNINETKQTYDRSQIKQCGRMKAIELIAPITSYTEYATDGLISRSIVSKLKYQMPDGKVVEIGKNKRLQIRPLIIGYFCPTTGIKRITKNNKKYLYNGVKISKKKLTEEMINVTKWILLDYRQKIGSSVYDDVDNLIATLNNLTNDDIILLYKIIDSRV